MNLQAFKTGESLAATLAASVASALEHAIAAKGSASLAVSGGSTPKRFFECLSRETLDWGKVTVTLVDERFVAETSDRSNAGLVRHTLLQGEAAAARFIALCPAEPGEGMPALMRAAGNADQAIADLRPLDVVILGMGTDGHTASFFPGGDHLAEATDPAATASIMTMQAPGAGEPRLTLTLPAILEAGLLVLHVEGADKHSVLEAAAGDGEIADMPIRAVLREAGGRLAVYWAP